MHVLHPLPKGFVAVFACAFPAEKTAEHGDLANDFSRILGTAV